MLLTCEMLELSALEDRQVRYGSRCAHRAVKRPRAPYKGCPNALRSAFDGDGIWLLATSRRVAGEGVGETPQGTPGP